METKTTIFLSFEKDVFPLEDGDIPASYVCFQEGVYLDVPLEVRIKG